MRPQVMTGHEPGSPGELRAVWVVGMEEEGFFFLRAGQRWFCRGTDESLERWVLTGREEGGDGEECREEGSVAVMLKSLYGCRTTCNQHSRAPSPITPSSSHTIRSGVHSVPTNSEPEPQNVTLSGNKVFANVICEGEVLLE